MRPVGAQRFLSTGPRRHAMRALSAVLAAGLLLTGCARPVAETAAPTRVDAIDVPSLAPDIDQWPAAHVMIAAADAVLPVRVADTTARRAKGLMDVAEIPDDVGMLFTYDDDHHGGFWMANTLVALDIAFIDADGAIIAIKTMQPCVDSPCPTYAPGQPYRAALEVPAGWFDQAGVTEGQHVTWTRLPNGNGR